MKNSIPTLTDPKGMGGIHAQDGFDYQVWTACLHIPQWLKNPAFEGVGVEMLDDFEARFFAPHAPEKHLLERFQVKKTQLTKSALKEVFNNFKTFDAAFPRKVRVYTLITPSLPDNLRWLLRDKKRVNEARPFYAPFTDIVRASDSKLLADLVNEFDNDLGQFIHESVNFFMVDTPNDMTAFSIFMVALETSFPNASNNYKACMRVYERLFNLLREKRGIFIPREDMIEAINDTIGFELIANSCLKINFLTDKAVEYSESLEVDARCFAHGKPIPKFQKWHTELLNPLMNTADWAKEQKIRKIELMGSFRLSAAFAVGWVFRSVSGFEIDIPVKTGVWSTDCYPRTQSSISWEVEEAQTLYDNRLLVSIGILHDPSLQVLKSCQNATDKNIFKIFTSQPFSSEEEMQNAVKYIKYIVNLACGKLQPLSVELFYRGPVAFAVVLGHQWNGFPSTSFYEYDPVNSIYMNTVSLPPKTE